MKPQPPCKDCDDRYVGCHSKCEKYNDYKMEQLDYQLAMDKIRGANEYFDKRAKKYAEQKRRKRK